MQWKLNLSVPILIHGCFSKALVFNVLLHVMHCDKTTESSAQSFIPYERKFILFFRHKEWLVGNDQFRLKFWAIWSCRWKNGNFQPIFTRSASAVTSNKKGQLSLMGSILRAFQWSKDEHSTLLLSALPKGGSKRNGPFPLKSALHLKKVCYKVFFCVNTVSDNVVRHLLVYPSVQKWFVGTYPACDHYSAYFTKFCICGGAQLCHSRSSWRPDVVQIWIRTATINIY